MTVFEQVKEAVTINQYLSIDEGNKVIRSPLRTDNNPSFSIFNEGRNWKDQSTSESGTIIDLVMQSHNVGLIEATQIIINQFNLPIQLGNKKEYTKEEKREFARAHNKRRLEKIDNEIKRLTDSPINKYQKKREAYGLQFEMYNYKEFLTKDQLTELLSIEDVNEKMFKLYTFKIKHPTLLMRDDCYYYLINKRGLRREVLNFYRVFSISHSFIQEINNGKHKTLLDSLGFSKSKMINFPIVFGFDEMMGINHNYNYYAFQLRAINRDSKSKTMFQAGRASPPIWGAERLAGVKNKKIYVTEGIIDAMSFASMDIKYNHPAIALTSINVKSPTADMIRLARDNILEFWLDNDNNPITRKASEDQYVELKKNLILNGVPAENIKKSSVLEEGDFKDANEFLQSITTIYEQYNS